MHEGKFTEQIVDAVMTTLRQHPGRRPKAVRVKVGEIYHLVPEAVLMHYAMLTRGTALDGVALHLEEEPMNVICDACGKTGRVEDHHMVVCPFCYSRDVRPLSGQQITVEAVELQA